MRRVTLVLTLAALMAAMVASAGPAKAVSNTGDFTTQQGFIFVGNDWWWSDDDDDDHWGWWSSGDGISFNSGDVIFTS